MIKLVSTTLLFLLHFPLLLSQENKLNRPQTPIEPFPYHSEDVNFENSLDGITLAGTFTYPKGEKTFPAVVLISGSGPNDRNCDYLEHKPFLVISDFFTRNGIAVLRFDKRGVGQSTGTYETATSVDFASDVEFAVTYLKTRKEVNKDKIGLVGHSEGGIIAPMVAEKTPDVHFIILMAGPTLKGDQLLLLQDRLISQIMGESESNLVLADKLNSETFRIATQNTSLEVKRKKLEEHLRNTYKENPSLRKPEKMSEDAFIEREINFHTDNWAQFYFNYDPLKTLEKVNIPLLAIFGIKDLQVPAKENSQILEPLALTKKDFTFKILPNLNHLFQESETGSPREYQQIEQTISPTALYEMLHWIQEQ